MISHPPTTCDRSKVSENGELRELVSWYWQNSGVIWQSLPLTIDGINYTHWWQIYLEDRVFPGYRAKKPSNLLVRVYVLLALRRVRRGLRERASP